MADEAQAVPEQDATTPAANDVTTGAEPGKQTETVKTFTQTELDAIVTERLQRAQRKAEEQTAKAKTEAERKAAEEQGQYQKLAESLKAELEQERQERQKTERKVLVRKVADELKFPVDFLDRVRGESEEEITADMRDFIAKLPKPAAPNINAGDASAASPKLPGGITDASLKEQAVRLGVKFEDFKAAFVNGRS
jgi:hypothetical protein